MKWTNMDLCMSEEGSCVCVGGVGGGLNNSHSSPYSLYPAGSNPSMLHPCLDWKAPWQPPGSWVTGKGCFYLLMRSVPGAPCLSASVSLHLPCAAVGRGERRLWMPAKWHQCHLHSSPPRPQSWAFWAWDGVRCCRAGGVTCIRLCPVGKITNGSEIAVPQSGSSLWNKCSHANQQSPHKPSGWCPPCLQFGSLIYCLCTNMVCVALYLLLKLSVIDVMLFCFLHTNQLYWKSSDRTVIQSIWLTFTFFKSLTV